MVLTSQFFTRLLVVLTMSSIDDRIIPDATEEAGISQQNEMNSVDGESVAANTRDSITDVIASRSLTNVTVRNNGLNGEPGIRQQIEFSSVEIDRESAASIARYSINGVLNQPSVANAMARNNETSDEPLGFPSVGISSAHARTDSWLEEQVARSSSYSLLQDAAAAVSNDGKTVTSMVLPEIPCLLDSGLDAQIAGLCARRGLMYNRLIQQIHIAEQLLDSSNVDMMNAEVANVDRKLSDFMEVNDRCQGLSRGRDGLDIANMADEADSKVFKLKQSVCKWMKLQEDNRSRSSKSSKGSTRSRSSRSSSHSSRRSGSSKGSHSSNKSVDNKARLAGLKMEAALLERSMEGRIESEIAQLRKERLADLSTQLEELKKQIKISEAMQNVYDIDSDSLEPVNSLKDITMNGRRNAPEARHARDKAALQDHKMKTDDIDCAKVHDSTIATSIPEMLTGRTIHTVGDIAKVDFDSTSETKTKELHDMPYATNMNNANNDKIDVADAMMQMINLNSAPVSDIDVFDGNPLDYDYFRATFADVIESKIKDQRGKLTRLIKYTSGEVKDLIKEFIHEDAETCFDMAINALDKEYGDSQRLTAA